MAQAQDVIARAGVPPVMNGQPMRINLDDIRHRLRLARRLDGGDQ